MIAVSAWLAAPGVAHAFLDDIGDFIRENIMGEKKPAAPRKLPGADKAPANGRVKAGRERAASGGNGKAAAAVPLPRPRPAALAGRAAGKGALPPKPNGPVVHGAPVVLDRSGKVVVKVDALGKERDSRSAVYLAPKEKGVWPRADVKAARNRCQIVLAATNVDATPLSPIGGPQGCGIAAPVRVVALGAVELKPAAKLNCTFTAAFYKWVTDVVQPAARRRFKSPVVAIRQLSHYACRRRGGITRGPVRISEHSFGNAIDVASFTLANGEKISVLHDWGGFTALFNRKAAFLREVHKGACGIFSTVLGPEANRAHKNHFHFDMGRGGRYKYCH